MPKRNNPGCNNSGECCESTSICGKCIDPYTSEKSVPTKWIVRITGWPTADVAGPICLENGFPLCGGSGIQQFYATQQWYFGLSVNNRTLELDIAAEDGACSKNEVYEAETQQRTEWFNTMECPSGDPDGTCAVTDEQLGTISISVGYDEGADETSVVVTARGIPGEVVFTNPTCGTQSQDVESGLNIECDCGPNPGITLTVELEAIV